MKLTDIKLTNPYTKLPLEFYDRVDPTPLKSPFLIHANEDMANILDIDIDQLYISSFVEWIDGIVDLNSNNNFAMCYAGHQFGYFVERLGDGRAINIGSIRDKHLQLKGAGTTLYSRGGDGRAVLRSSIREYLMSEAMYGLNIPTTRALAIIGSTQRVFREDWEKTSIVCRVSTSWIRFGTFQYFSFKQKYKELRELLDYTIEESYSHLIGKDSRDLLFFEELVDKTAKLMAKWQCVGFNHGVMNTDNFSIAGLTIDYGPFAFLDDYDSSYICNHIDQWGRYSFGNQPNIGEWNLNALLEALSPIIDKETMVEVLDSYGQTYTKEYIGLMSAKLGLIEAQKDDTKLIKQLLEVMSSLQIDYTLFFRTLSRYSGNRDKLLKLGLYHRPLDNWLDSYDERLKSNNISQIKREESMLSTNPYIVLKNYILQEAIERADNGDYTLVEELFKIAQNPYIEYPNFERYSIATPNEFKNRKLSCSS